MKVALLFLTYGNPIHEDKWNEYLTNQDIQILIHAKYLDTLNEIWRPHLSSKLIDTAWGSMSIVNATLLLMKQAFDSGADWFVLCSEDSYPLLSSNELIAFLTNETKSIFHLTDPVKNPNKTSQWFAINREDASTIVNNLNIQLESGTIGNKQLVDRIVRTFPKKAAADELFFLPLLKNLTPNYQYKSGMVHYVKWMSQWVSKHPTIFNRLLPNDQQIIRESNALFIRKTFPTFENVTIVPKQNALVVTLGTENIGKTDYSELIASTKETHDLFLLVMVDNMNDISDNLKTNCIQSYSVVWNMVDTAYVALKTILPYSNVTVLKEKDPPAIETMPTNAKAESDEIKPAKKILQIPSQVKPSQVKPLQNQPKADIVPRSRVSLYDYNPRYKIAFMFLLREDLNQPQIWDQYFTRESDYSVSLYTHSKNDRYLRTRWLYNSLIRNLKRTEWGHIVDAYFSLLSAAMENPDNQKFIFISESCLPIMSFRDLKHFLDGTDYRESLVHFMNISTYDQHERIEKQPNYQRFGQFTKHYARMCLSRYHVEKLLRSPRDAIDFFIRMHVGDEFFLTLLNARPGYDYFTEKIITYDNWDDVHYEVRQIKERLKSLEHEQNYKRTDSHNDEIQYLKRKINDISKNPKTYYEVTNRDIERAFQSGAFFWRKFPEDIRMGQYYTNYGALKRPYSRRGGRKRTKKYVMRKNKKNESKRRKRKQTTSRKTKRNKK